MSDEGETGSFSGSARTADPGAAVFLLLMVLIGSTTATAAKYGVKEIPLSLLPLIRFGVAGLCLMPVVWRGGAFAAMLGKDLPRIVATAAFCVPINQAFFLAGTRLAPTSHVGVIYATCPLVVLLLASALGQERLVMRRLMGVVLSVLGVVVIGAGNLLKAGPEDMAALRGDLLLVGAVVSWGAYLTVNKPLVARYGSIPTLAGTFLFGATLQLPVALATWPGGEALKGISPTAWGAVFYLALMVTVFGLFCQNQSLRRLDASQVATVGNAAPLLTIVWGVLLLGEDLGWPLIVGSGLTLGGILWASRPARQPRGEESIAVVPALEPA